MVRGETVAVSLLLAGDVLAFSTALTVQFTLPKLLVLSAGMAVLSAFWAVRARRGGVRPLPLSIAVPTGLLAASWIASVFFAADRPTALDGAPGRFNGLWTSATLLLLFITCATAVVPAREQWLRVKALLAALACAAGYTIAQSAGWDAFTWPFTRPAATIGQPVILATMLGLGAPFALVLALGGAPGRLKWAALFLLLIAAAVLTQSRGPLIGIAVACGVAVVAERGTLTRRLVAVTAIVLALVVAAGGAYIAHKRSGRWLPSPSDLMREPEMRNRLHTLGAAAAMARDHVWTGVGLENYSVLYPRYRPAEAELVTPDSVPTMVHSGYLQVLVTTGLPGLAVYLAFLIAVAVALWRASTSLRDGKARGLAVGALASMAGFCVADVSGWPEVSTGAAFFFVLGMGVSTANGEREHRGRTPRPIASAAAVAVTVLLALLTWRVGQFIRADSLLRSGALAAARGDWPSALGFAADAKAAGGGRPAVEDAAGLLFAQQFGATGDRESYAAAARSFETAVAEAPFHEYYALHRIDLETAALQKAKGGTAAPAVEGMVTALTAFEHHNAAIHESIARLRFAQGQHAVALAAIRRAQALRPQGGYWRLQGDIERAMDDRRAAFASYKRALAAFPAGTPDWLNIKYRIVVTLLELGIRDAAISELQEALFYAPRDSMLHRLMSVATESRGGPTGS